MSRPLTKQEIALYSRFSEIIAESDRPGFLKQIRHARIAKEDSGHTTFEISENITSIDIEPFETYLDAFYDDDDDGEVVTMIMHFVPPGVVSWVERFHILGKPVNNTRPNSDQMRFSMLKSIL